MTVRVDRCGTAGVDMTDEMLTLARSNAVKAGVANVEFVKGAIEDVPLPDASVDVVISNCLMSTDKPAGFAETYRVLRPNGRLGVSDIVAENHLNPAQRAERGGYVAGIAGAMAIGEYREGLETAGFTDVTISPTQQIADGIHSAIIRANNSGR